MQALRRLRQVYRQLLRDARAGWASLLAGRCVPRVGSRAVRGLGTGPAHSSVHPLRGGAWGLPLLPRGPRLHAAQPLRPSTLAASTPGRPDMSSHASDIPGHFDKGQVAEREKGRSEVQKMTALMRTSVAVPDQDLEPCDCCGRLVASLETCTLGGCSGAPGSHRST